MYADPFSATSCVVFAIDMGINIVCHSIPNLVINTHILPQLQPAPCKPCLPFLKKTAISLGAKACDGAKVAGNCFINSAPVKACKGVFCKLTGQQPAPLLPITQPRIPLAHLPFSHQANDVAVPTGAPPIPNRKPESPVRRPLSPVRQPASPVQRSASPVQRTASPVQRTAGPVRKPTIQVKKPGSPRLSRSKSARDLDNVLSNVQV